MEVADVFRQHFLEYQKTHRVSAAEYKVANALMQCRTAELGGHVLKCTGCGKHEISYNSCRNRHCPKCGGGKAAKWVTERSKELLSVGYFHTVFTLPAGIRPLAKTAPREMSDLFFQAVSQTLLQVGRKNLRCEIAATCVLHTWGSTLVYHPHIHCLIPGCGITSEGKALRFKKKRYFVSDKILSQVFRGKFCSLLKKAYRRGELPFYFDDIDVYLDSAVQKQWVVRTTPPFAGPSVCLKYLARYTNRVAISNRRILEVTKDHVRIRYKSYRQGGISRTMSFSPHEFIRRFLQHVLPTGFVRIRHYGFLSRQKKESSLALLREALGESRVSFKPHRARCPHCKSGTLEEILEFPPLFTWKQPYLFF
ncbi:MAG: IS91 family transposase [Bdellovibrionales bacterium]|nr:IS91 family transposase [Bdellovibrionales bacterium]